MSVKGIRTGSYAPRDEFARWLELTQRSHFPSRVTCDDPANFRASAHVLDIGTAQVSTLAHPTVDVHRTAKMVRQSDPEVYHLHLVTSGCGRVAQAGRETVFKTGEFVMLDSSRVFEGRRSATTAGQTRAVVAQVPKAALGLRFPMDQLVAATFSSRQGMAAVLAAHLLTVMDHTQQYTAADRVALGEVTLDLIAATCAHHLDIAQHLSPEARRRALLAQIHRFIQLHLPDSSLNAELIAAAHHISTRQLYNLFQSHGSGMSVMAYIRHARLERCYRDLADPNLRSHTIHTIAARWGLPDSAQFSKLFSAAYGLSPREYRHQAAPGTVRFGPHRV
ncbi:helix-turn-helix domain-containing protein [Sphaerisporangium sp. NPDC005288]|uniref:AraC-like ligand-binding domain-containing protein n=1 Tax=Sphaerisporangium sp. NPDC005288 TaxID=3155114 RepID=UPI0033BC9C30